MWLPFSFGLESSSCCLGTVLKIFYELCKCGGHMQFENVAVLCLFVVHLALLSHASYICAATLKELVKLDFETPQNHCKA